MGVTLCGRCLKCHCSHIGWLAPGVLLREVFTLDATRPHALTQKQNHLMSNKAGHSTHCAVQDMLTSGEPKFLVEGASRFDVVQGEVLGDCWSAYVWFYSILDVNQYLENSKLWQQQSLPNSRVIYRHVAHFQINKCCPDDIKSRFLSIWCSTTLIVTLMNHNCNHNETYSYFLKANLFVLWVRARLSNVWVGSWPQSGASRFTRTCSPKWRHSRTSTRTTAVSPVGRICEWYVGYTYEYTVSVLKGLNYICRHLPLPLLPLRQVGRCVHRW